MVEEQDKDGKLKLRRIKRSSHQIITFLLHKNDNYGREITINKKKESPNDQFYNYTIYEHKPTRKYASAKAKVLYNDNFKVADNVQIEDEDKFQVQQKTYEKIETYSYDRSKDVHLLIKFTISYLMYDFFKRVDKSGVYWKQIDSGKAVNLKRTGVADELSKIEYEINKSIKIQLDKSIEYPVKLVENSSISRSSEYPVDGNLNITVSEQNECIEASKYKCYVHDLTQCSSGLSEVAGLRLYNETQEIKLYKNDPASEDDIEYLYYLHGGRTTKNLTFYFNGTDLLLFCYSKKSYKPDTKDHYKLVHYRTLEPCECTSENRGPLMGILEKIKRELSQETTGVPGPGGTNPLRGSDPQAKSSSGHSNVTQNQDSLSEFWKNNKIYILSGGGAALGAVSIVGLGVIIYKKCVKVTAAVAIDPVL